MGLFAFLYCLAITEHPWVPDAGEPWKRQGLDSVLKCPKVSGVAGALKPYGLGYGAQACYFTTWGLSFPICNVGHRTDEEQAGERGSVCKYSALPVLSIGGGVVLAARSPVWGHWPVALSVSRGPCPPLPPPGATGGFNKFQTEYSEHCETNVDSSSSPSGSPPTSVLGLGGLRISSDCSDGESDRELPSSATESDGSPVPSSQPAFPVQILPYLYLGCAKDSTNLDVLGKYGIKYILNVTPNLPNAFEHGGEFTYKQIPISDHWSQNLSQFFPEAISFIGKSSCAQAGGAGLRVEMCGALGVAHAWLGYLCACRGLCAALRVPACANGCTGAHCESLRPSGLEQAPDLRALHSCWSSLDSAVQTPWVFWLCCLELSTLKRPSSQTSHGSHLPCVTPQHMFLEDGLSRCLFGLYCVPEGAEG